jgi:hypothetical protein
MSVGGVSENPDGIPEHRRREYTKTDMGLCPRVGANVRGVSKNPDGIPEHRTREYTNVQV